MRPMHRHNIAQPQYNYINADFKNLKHFKYATTKTGNTFVCLQCVNEMDIIAHVQQYFPPDLMINIMAVDSCFFQSPFTLAKSLGDDLRLIKLSTNSVADWQSVSQYLILPIFHQLSVSLFTSLKIRFKFHRLL